MLIIILDVICVHFPRNRRLMDMVVHVGDISYADDYSVPNVAIWDVYMHRKQTQAANVPYMTCPGKELAREIT